jgi:hypothetical protein
LRGTIDVGSGHFAPYRRGFWHGQCYSVTRRRSGPVPTVKTCQQRITGRARLAHQSDADGKPVMAENKYVLHFGKDELPPAGAFWSLTLYDAEGFQVANSLNRFAIGDRDPLNFNADGSLDLYIQNQSPGVNREANWLPAPNSGRLELTLRIYAPKPQVADGRWNPPPVRRDSDSSGSRALQ